MDELRVFNRAVALDGFEAAENRAFVVGVDKEVALAEFKRAKIYALDHRARLLGNAQSAKTNVASWGFKFNPAKVIPLVKIKDDDMVSQLLALPENRGAPYLSATYKLDKSKISDGLSRGVKWLGKLFQLTQSEQFFADKIKDKVEGEAR